MSPPELQAVRHQINDMLRQDIIQPSKSLWGAPAILVRRKDLHGKPQPPRFVVDYRALNSVTKSDGFPLPQVIDILNCCAEVPWNGWLLQASLPKLCSADVLPFAATSSKRNKQIQLTTQVEAQFNDLIAVLTGPDVLLHYPDWSKPFHVHTDATKLVVGAVLMQGYDQHCCAQSVEQWRPYLLGRKFVVETDHANLEWLCSIAPHKAKLARWASLPAEYDFELHHRPGHTNTVPDALTPNTVSQQPQQGHDSASAAFVAHCHPWLCPFT